MPAGKLNLLTKSKRTLLLKTWNATEKDFPAHLCVHQLFEQQVERTPQATVLVYEDQTLSYAELNDMLIVSLINSLKQACNRIRVLLFAWRARRRYLSDLP